MISSILVGIFVVVFVIGIVIALFLEENYKTALPGKILLIYGKNSRLIWHGGTIVWPWVDKHFHVDSGIQEVNFTYQLENTNFQVTILIAPNVISFQTIEQYLKVATPKGNKNKESDYIIPTSKLTAVYYSLLSQLSEKELSFLDFSEHLSLKLNKKLGVTLVSMYVTSDEGLTLKFLSEDSPIDMSNWLADDGELIADIPEELPIQAKLSQ